MADSKLTRKLSGGGNRQKVILIATFIVFVILIWQVYGMFSSNTPPPTTKTAASKGGVAAATKSQPITEVAIQLPEGKIMNDPEFLKLQKQSEERYVRRLNDLEELRIQRQIAETNQGIAAARLATVTAEKNISELLTTPSAQSMAASAEYARQLAAQQQRGAGEGNDQIPVPPPMPIVVDYQLVSVSMQLHKWSAVMSYQTNLYSVTVGDRLPPDGSIVTNINRNSVILRKDDEVRRIAIVSSLQ